MRMFQLPHAALALMMPWAMAALAQTSPAPASQPASATMPAGHTAAKAPFAFGLANYDIPPFGVQPATPVRVIDLLSQALASKPVASRRVELVRDLGESGLPAAVQVVIGAMSDPDPAVRAQAAKAASTLADPAAVPSLRLLLADADVSVRIEAIQAGAIFDDPAFVTAGLDDKDESCFRASCALASASEHDARIIARYPTLSMGSKVIAIRAIARREGSPHVQLVADQLASADVPLLVEAMNALAKMKAVQQFAAVRQFLSHAHPTIRRTAVSASAVLASAQDQMAIALQMLNDPDLPVRQMSSDLLIANPSADAIAALVQQLSAGYRPLRQSARNALAAAAGVASQAVISEAVRLLGDENPHRRADGSYILGRIKSDAALEVHMKLLADPDWFVVQQAAESLGSIGRAEAGDGIEKIALRAIEHDETKARAPNEMEAIGTAFLACGQLRHKPAIPLMKKVIPQKLSLPAELRSCAIWAAGVAGDADDSALIGMCVSIANDDSPYEHEEPRFEAIKAIGNLRSTATLEEMRRQAGVHRIPSLRWMAHAVADRLTGDAITTPYVPPDVPTVADTSIQDMSR